MKEIIKLFLGILFTFVGLILILASAHSCKLPKPVKHVEYIYVKGDYLTDSAKIRMAKWITETMKASSSQMTGGDYEDPEDVIKQLEKTGTRLFTVKVDGLQKWNYGGSYWNDFVPVYELTKRELFILDSIKNR